jgi:hypothetical protein
MHQPLEPLTNVTPQPRFAPPAPAPTSKRPTWWLGMGIVLGSLLGYWVTYHATQATTEEWFAVPFEVPQTPQKGLLQPLAAHADQQAEGLAIRTIEAAILDKKEYFDRQSERYHADVATLQTNQAEILKIARTLDQTLATLAADPTAAVPADVTAAAQQLSTLASQDFSLTRLNTAALTRRQRSYEQIRLLEQIDASKRGADKHAQMAIHFHSQGKASVIVSLVLGVAAGALGVLISREGWDKSDNRFIYAFALLSTMALFFNQLPRVMQSEINFQNNRDIYLGYLTLRNTIHTFVATEKGVGVNPDEPDRFDDLQTNRFLHSVDAKLAELNQLRIGIDATQRVDISNVLTIPSR